MIDRFATPVTVVSAVAELLLASESLVAEVTVAVLLIVPGVVPDATTPEIVTLVLPPEASVPSEQLSACPDNVQVGAPGVTEMPVSAAGKVSFTVTPAAALGPALLTPSVYCSVPPTATEGGLPVFVIDRFATPVTVVSAVAELLLASESLVAEVTVAVLLIVPGVVPDATTPEIVTLVLPPEASVPSAQLSPCPDNVQVGAPGVTEMPVSAAGRVSFTVTPAAALGPALLTCSVYCSVLPPLPKVGCPSS